MDKIIIENMCFFGYHGVLPEEKVLGQKFFLDITLYLPLQKAGCSDDLRDSVDYGAVYCTIRDIVTKEKFALLEGLAERICRVLFVNHPAVEKIVLRVKKPNAPIEGLFDYTGIEIERDRI